MGYDYLWTDGTNKDFAAFSQCMEAYYNKIVGGIENRKSFVPYNSLADIHDVLIVYDQASPVACAAFKEYDALRAEIKRVWVSEPYRGRHISKEMMGMIEHRAKEKGYEKVILQTREACIEAVALYKAIGYERIENYPPYDKMELAVCYGKDL